MKYFSLCLSVMLLKTTIATTLKFVVARDFHSCNYAVRIKIKTSFVPSIRKD